MYHEGSCDVAYRRTRWRRGRVENEQQAALLSTLSAVSASSLRTGNICVCEERVGGWDLSAVITSEAPGVAARSERAGEVYHFQTTCWKST